MEKRERRVCEAGSKRNIYDFVLNYWCANIEFSPRNTLGLELLLPRSKASFSIWKSLMQRHIDYSNDQKPSNEHHHSNLAQKVTIFHSFRNFSLVKVLLVGTKKNCQLGTCYSLLIIFFMNSKESSKDKNYLLKNHVKVITKETNWFWKTVLDKLHFWKPCISCSKFAGHIWFSSSIR